MDTLQVERNRSGVPANSWAYAGYGVVDLRVNGELLQDIITKYEQAAAFDVVGGYGSMSEFGARDKLLGDARAGGGWLYEDDTVLLICGSCGEEGCWPLVAKIRVTDATVEWTRFNQYHREDRDYSPLRFEFDRKAYEAAVDAAGLAETPPQPTANHPSVLDRILRRG